MSVEVCSSICDHVMSVLSVSLRAEWRRRC